MTTSPKGQAFAYQNSPSTLSLFLVIAAGPDYPAVDMTTVTTVEATCVQTKPDGTLLTLTWTLTPVVGMTTATSLVASYAYQPGDTLYPGNHQLFAVPFVNTTPLPPMVPQTFAVRAPPLS